VTLVFAVIAGIVLALLAAAILAALVTVIFGALFAAVCIPFAAVKSRLRKHRAASVADGGDAAEVTVEVPSFVLASGAESLPPSRPAAGWFRPVAAALFWAGAGALVDLGTGKRGR
jgi:hypothetical protein